MKLVTSTMQLWTYDFCHDAARTLFTVLLICMANLAVSVIVKNSTWYVQNCDSVTKPQPVPQTQADTPSGFKPQSFILSLIIFQKIFWNFHLGPYT